MKAFQIAILGRPNAGKSSFVNVLLGKQRIIVTDVAGTTRDTINSRYKLFGQDFILTDTAGIRKIQSSTGYRILLRYACIAGITGF